MIGEVERARKWIVGGEEGKATRRDAHMKSRVARKSRDGSWPHNETMATRREVAIQREHNSREGGYPLMAGFRIIRSYVGGAIHILESF